MDKIDVDVHGPANCKQDQRSYADPAATLIDGRGFALDSPEKRTNLLEESEIVVGRNNVGIDRKCRWLSVRVMDVRTPCRCLLGGGQTRMTTEGCGYQFGRDLKPIF